MRALAVACFLLSGASGLIFQVIWTRQFSLVFGATTLALSTVLTAFMGGLALGSYLAGRLADRIRDPLKAYALAEAGVGLCALALPLVVGRFGDLNRLLYEHLADHYVLLAGMRFIASAAIILVPTTLMGATLPLLSRYFVRTEAEHARIGMRVGTLYAINTAGAVLGTAIGGFALLPALGLAWTNRIAAGANLILALAVAVAYRLQARRPAAPPADAEITKLLAEIGPVRAVPVQISPAARRATLAAFAVSGAAAMIYQVIWTRALNMAIGSSVYSFTIVLTAFLVGLAGGAALIGRLTAGSRNPIGLLALNHVAIVVLVGLSYLLIDRVGQLYVSFFVGQEIDANRTLWSQFSVTLLAMLPATLAMGGIFPLTIRICAAGLDRVGKDVGTAYSLNTVGAIAGAFLAGFVVIPVLQLQPGMYAAVCMNLALAVLLGLLAPWPRRFRLSIAGGAAVLAASGPLLPRWDLHRVAAGVFRPTVARDVIKTGRWERPQLVYHRDGISTTVSVEKWSSNHFSLKNNGKVDASTGDDMPTQILVGLLPLLLHPQAGTFAPDVALIGYASGVSAGAVLQYPVRSLDVVELEPAILEASRFFEHVNHRPLADPRLRVTTDDGRNFLAAGTKRYDVIVNEPSNPWITGVSNLFTRDYFEIGKRRLRPGGIFCSWAQLYEMAPRRIKSIYRAFTSVFPYVYVFSAATLSSDTFLMGSDRPLKLDIRRLRRAFSIPSVQAEMKRAEVQSPHDLVALALLVDDEVDAYVIGSAVNTDDNALVEFHAPRDLYNHRRYDYYLSRVHGQSWIYGRLSRLIGGYRDSEDYAGLVQGLLSHGRFREAHLFFERVDPDRGPLSRRADHLMDLLESHEVIDPEVKLTESGGALQPPLSPKQPLSPPEAERVAREYYLVEQRVRRGHHASALELIEGWPERAREEAGGDFQLLWGFVAYKTSNFAEAVNILEPLWDDTPFVERRPALLYYLGRAFYGNADYAKALRALNQWIDHRQRVGKPVAPRPQQAPASVPASAPAPREPGAAAARGARR